MKTQQDQVNMTQLMNELEPQVLLAESVEHLSYHEMAAVPVQKQDPLLKLSENLDDLELLQSKMSFIFREIRYLLKV